MPKTNTLLSAAVAVAGCMILFGAPPNTCADIELHEKLTLSGWVDFNYVKWNRSEGASDDRDFGLTEVELNLALDLSEKVKGRVDISFDRNGTDLNGEEDFDGDIEVATITYIVTDELSLSGGKFLSFMGWEAFDLINLYQFSGGGPQNAYIGNGIGYPAFQNGVRATYATDMFSVGASYVDDVWGPTARSTDYDVKDEGFEAMAKLTAIDNFTLFLGYAQQDGDGSGGPEDSQYYNAWASYKFKDLLVALEYVTEEDLGVTGITEDGDAWLAMANYTFTDWLAVTLRYTDDDRENAATNAETANNYSYAIAPIFTISDNLGMIIEYKHTEDRMTNASDTDQFAVELTLTF